MTISSGHESIHLLNIQEMEGDGVVSPNICQIAILPPHPLEDFEGDGRKRSD